MQFYLISIFIKNLLVVRWVEGKGRCGPKSSHCALLVSLQLIAH